MNKKKISYLIFYMAMFIFFIVFYEVCHPFIMQSPDDWLYISFGRLAVPLPTSRLWNPSRIFPETMMPLVGDIGAFVVYPLIGDYLHALSVSMGLFAAVVLFGYVWSFGYMLKTKYHANEVKVMILSILFLSLHFWVFRYQHSDNPCVLISTAPNLFFYYTAPTLYCLMLVFLIESNAIDFGKLVEDKRFLRAGMLLLALYLGVFSNLFASQILAIYCVVRLIIKNVKCKSTIRDYLKQVGFELCIVVAWIYGAVCDLCGGRATYGARTAQDSVLNELLVSFRGMIRSILKTNKYFLLFLFVIVALVLYIGIRYGFSRQGFTGGIWFLAYSVINVIYILLLCAFVNSSYIEREDVMLSTVSLLVVGFVLIVSEVLETIPTTLMVMPLVLFVIIFNIRTGEATFGSADSAGWTKKNAEMVIEAVAAEEEGRKPVFQIEEWNNLSERKQAYNYVITTLYRHGIIQSKIEID